MDDWRAHFMMHQVPISFMTLLIYRTVLCYVYYISRFAHTCLSHYAMLIKLRSLHNN